MRGLRLFWSQNALASPHVRREWEHALSLGRDNFIRPVYWESPLPQADGLPPEPLNRIHFQFLGGIAATAAEDEETEEADAEVDDLWCADDAAFDYDAAELGSAEADEVRVAAAAASDPDGGQAIGPTRGILVGVGIAVVVVPFVIWLIASLFYTA